MTELKDMDEDTGLVSHLTAEIELEFYDPGNVDLEKTYQNVVQHG